MGKACGGVSGWTGEQARSLGQGVVVLLAGWSSKLEIQDLTGLACCIDAISGGVEVWDA